MNLYDVHKENELTSAGEQHDILTPDEANKLAEMLIAVHNGEHLLTAAQREKLKPICDRYADHGVTMAECEYIVAGGMLRGFDFELSVIGLRLGLSNEYHTHEYFTSADVSRMTGETPEQVEQYIQEHETELYENGCIAKMSFVDPR